MKTLESQAKRIIRDAKVMSVIHRDVSSKFADTDNFEKHSAAQVTTWADYLLVYVYNQLNNCWDLDEEVCQIEKGEDYYCMVVPVIGGVPKYDRWSFAPSWWGLEEREDRWLGLAPPLRAKRVSVEKRRSFRGNPSMMVGVFA